VIKLLKSFVLIGFIGLLVSPILLNPDLDWYKRSSIPSKNEVPDTSFHFDEVAVSSGIAFSHESPILDPKISHIQAQIASMGASVSICDYNNDGWSDLYFTNSRTNTANALYRNEGNGRFAEVGEQMDIANINNQGTGVSMGSVWGDFDNDGYRDLLVYKWGKPLLFRNVDGIRFEDVTEGSGLPPWVNANSAIWADFNNDGLIDLFIGGYYRENIDLWHLQSTNFMQESFEYANNGGRNYLLINQNNGRFLDKTTEMGLSSHKWTLAAGAMDINNDHYPELFIANDYGIDEVWLNIQGKQFKEIGKDMGLGFAPKSGMNISFGDIENHGQLGVYVTNITEDGVLIQGNNMWIPEISDGNLVYSNTARERGIELGGWSYGAQFGDFNNDGFNDLYVANGYISGKKGTSYWYDYSKISGGSKAIIADAKNWPSMEGKSQSGYQQNKIWLNKGHGKFLDASDMLCKDNPRDSRTVALADLWNRGVVDVVVANQNSRPFVYKNSGEKVSNWMEINLIGNQSNRDAIGAKVTLYWRKGEQTQVVTGGIGFSGQNQHRLHFGLGGIKKVEKIMINWPSGIDMNIESPEINKLLTIKEKTRS